MIDDDLQISSLVLLRSIDLTAAGYHRQMCGEVKEEQRQSLEITRSTESSGYGRYQSNQTRWYATRK